MSTNGAKVYRHGNRNNSSNSGNSNTDSVTCEIVNYDRPPSLVAHPGNILNDRLIYDIPSVSFKPSSDPIDDRVRKNTLLIDWIKRLDTNLITKYSYEKFKDTDQIEIYHFLSSKVLAKEAVNYLTILHATPKAIYTEYYNSIRDIYYFLKEKQVLNDFLALFRLLLSFAILTKMD